MAATLGAVSNRRMLFQYFDWAATFLWAVTGALLGARRGYDLIGIFVVAIVSSAGGGLLRDGIFLQDGPPRLLRSGVLLGLITVATLAVVFSGRWIKNARQLTWVTEITDALGLGAYAVWGMNLAQLAGLPTLSVIAVGMVNAVGGGMLRDILLRSPRRILEPGQWQGSAALVGCILFVGLERTRLDVQVSAWIAVAVVFLLRLAAIRFDLRSRPLPAFEEDWRKTMPEDQS